MLASKVQAIRWENNQLFLIDQRVLPSQTEYISCHNVDEVAAAIKNMVVRGAPAIGISAAYGMALAATDVHSNPLESLEEAAEVLNASRPTAVNLFWATAEMLSFAKDNISRDNFPEQMLEKAKQIHAEDIQLNSKMAELGGALISENATVMTHCNTGALATGGIGTALGVVRYAAAHRNLKMAIACETRPWNQGARLTAWEMVQDSIPAKLITDSAASYVMKSEKPEWVIVGADRIAADGSVANKIGTYQLAVSAKYHGVKFMVVAPHTTVDLATASGNGIEIELRSDDEITHWKGIRVAAEKIDVFNPAFDVTPPELIDCIVTDRGVIHQQDFSNIASIIKGN